MNESGHICFVSFFIDEIILFISPNCHCTCQNIDAFQFQKLGDVDHNKNDFTAGGGGRNQVDEVLDLPFTFRCSPSKVNGVSGHDV